MLDCSTIVGIGSAIASGVIAFLIWRTKAAQNKTDSANLMVKLREPLTTTEPNPISETIHALRENQPYDEDGLIDLLNHFELVVIFHNDGVLTSKHVKEFYVPFWKLLVKDHSVKQHIERQQKVEPTAYENFVGLLKKWKYYPA